MSQTGYNHMKEAAHHAELRGHALTLNLEGIMVEKETPCLRFRKLVAWEVLADAINNPILDKMDEIDNELLLRRSA